MAISSVDDAVVFVMWAGEPLGVGLQSIGSPALPEGKGRGKGRGKGNGIGTDGTVAKLTDRGSGSGVDKGGNATILLSEAKEFMTGAVIGVMGRFSDTLGTCKVINTKSFNHRK